MSSIALSLALVRHCLGFALRAHISYSCLLLFLCVLLPLSSPLLFPCARYSVWDRQRRASNPNFGFRNSQLRILAARFPQLATRCKLKFICIYSILHTILVVSPFIVKYVKNSKILEKNTNSNRQTITPPPPHSLPPLPINYGFT